MASGRTFLCLLTIICAVDQRLSAPAIPADVVVQPGLRTTGPSTNRLVRLPMRMQMPQSPGIPQLNAMSQSTVQRPDRMVFLKPVTILIPTHQHPLSQAGGHLTMIPKGRPMLLHPERVSEDEATNDKQSLVDVTQAPAGGASNNATSLSFYFPIKIDGTTVFVERNVTLATATTDEEEEVSSEPGAGKSTGLNRLTREELAEIISRIVLQVLKENRDMITTTTLSSLSPPQTWTSPTTTSTIATAAQEDSSQSVSSDPSSDPQEDRSRDEVRGESERRDVGTTGEELEAGTVAATPEDGGEAERSADGIETGMESGSDEVPVETTSPQMKTRRQLPATGVRGKSVQKFRSQSGSRPGVLGLRTEMFKPVSTTPDPEAVVPVDQTDTMDPILLTDFQDQLLRNKQIVIVDRDKHKNQLFLKAISEVLQDFQQMYEIPHDDDDHTTAPSATTQDILPENPITSPDPLVIDNDVDPSLGQRHENRTTTPVPLN